MRVRWRSFVAPAGALGLWLISLLTCHSQPAGAHVASLPDLHLSSAGTVYAMAVQDDGRIIIGGKFSSVNGVPVNNLARITTEGAVDANWTPNPNDAVSSLVVSGTNVFVGGYFTSVGGVTRIALARVSTMGTGLVDTNWDPQIQGGGIYVQGLGLAGTNLFVTGGFTSIGGQNRANAAALNAFGSPATALAWAPSLDKAGDCLLVDTTNIYLGGFFTQINGITHNRLARISTAGIGTVDSTWDPNADPAAPPGGQTHVSAILLNSTNLYVSGAFTNIGGFARSGLAKISTLGNGAADSVWNPQPNSPAGYFGLALSGSNLFVGGQFTTIGGLARTNLASLDASGAGNASTNWSVTFNLPSSIGFLLTNGSWLLAGGSFSVVDGAVSVGLTKLDLQTAVMDDSFFGNVGSPGSVYAMTRQSDGKIIVGGDFWLAGSTPRPHLARVNTDGSLDTAWAPAADGIVYAFALNGTDLFVGGDFSSINGQLRNGLAKVDTSTGQVNTSWNPPTGPGAAVAALAASPEGKLYVGGIDLGINGLADISLARVNAGGSGLADSNWTKSSDGSVDALVYNLGNLFAGGTFTTIDGQTRDYLAKFPTNLNGSADASWIVPADSSVYALADDGTNLFVGGAFTNVSGQYRRELAKVSMAGTGNVDPSWIPGVQLGLDPSSDQVLALSITGSNLYVGGEFGGYFPNLARVSVNSTGAVDTAWAPRLPGTAVCSLVANGEDAYVGGIFQLIGGTNVSGTDAYPRNGFALLATPDAPVMTKISSSHFMVLPNPIDGPEVTDFKITAINGTSLFLSDGVTPVFPGNFISAAQGAAGLVFTGSTGMVTAVSAVDRTPAGTGTAPTTLNLAAVQPPVFRFSSATYSQEEDGGVVIITVQKLGTGSGSVNYSTGGGSAVAGPTPTMVVVPNSFSNTVGDANDTAPFGGPIRYQQVYAASQFGAVSPGGSYITAIALRPSANFGSSFTNTLPSIQIDLSTTTKAPDGLSTNFSLNVGADNIVVFNGPLTLNSADAGSPPEFDVVIPLATPFFYNPTNGNLLLDVQNIGGGTTTFFDATLLGGDSVSRVFGTPVTVANGATSTLGLITQFSFQSAPYGSNNYAAVSGTLNFGAEDTELDIIIPVEDDLVFDGDKTFNLKLFNPGTGAIAATTTITVLNTDPAGPVGSLMTNAPPAPLPPATGVLSITFPPGLTNAQWRLAGQAAWQAGGAGVSNLVTGNYPVEFNQVNGFLRPDTMLVHVTSGAFLQPQVPYQLNPIGGVGPGIGYITEIIYPNDVASNADVSLQGQWRPVGSGTWLNSGDVISGLFAGDVYPVEFKAVPNRNTPANDTLTVIADEGAASVQAKSTYYGSMDGFGLLPGSVNFDSLTTNQPFQFAGQLRTELGFGSGAVLKNGVMLTAAHLLFDSSTLSYANAASWYYQRYAGGYEPPPQVPRGFQVRSSYSAQREADGTLGQQSFQSESVDVAAVYFLQSAGRGGFGGYLVSDPNTNWLSSSRLKILTGYPVGVAPASNQGKLMATPASSAPYFPVQSYDNLFCSTNITGYPGMDGGAVEVLADDGNYYPAGIYLGPNENTNLPTVRAIDAGTADLINLADRSANAQVSFTQPSQFLIQPMQPGGGISSGSYGTTATNSVSVNTGYSEQAVPAILEVKTGPPGALKADGGWRLSTEPMNTWHTDAAGTATITGGTDPVISFNCIPNESFAVPYQTNGITVLSGQLSIVDLEYLSPPTNPILTVAKDSSGVVIRLSNCSTNYTYEVDYATDPVNGPWTILGQQQTIKAPANSFIFRDAPVIQGNRFYRAQWITCPVAQQSK